MVIFPLIVLNNSIITASSNVHMMCRKRKKGRRKTSERTREWLKASASKDFR
jgi:hypothetical protein